MYYVIQHNHNNPRKHFITYKVPKFITAKNNDNVIFEFKTEKGVKRKWAPKKDIILLTDNKEFYDLMVKRLETIENRQLEKIEEAEEELQNAVKDMVETMNAAVFADGSLTTKTKELMAVAVAIAVQCPYCIEIHKANAVKAGATEPEITEAAFVAASIGAGAAVTHSSHAL